MQIVLLASHEDPPAVALQETQVLLDITCCCVRLNHTILNSHGVCIFKIKQYESIVWPWWRRNHDCLIHQNLWHIGIISATERGKGQYKSHGEGGHGAEHLAYVLIFSQSAIPPPLQSPKKLFHHGPNPLSAAQDTMPFLNRLEPSILLLISKKQLGRTCYKNKSIGEGDNICRFFYVAWRLHSERRKRSSVVPVIDIWWYQEYYRDKTVHGHIHDNLNLHSTDHKYTIPGNTRTIAMGPVCWYTK